MQPDSVRKIRACLACLKPIGVACEPICRDKAWASKLFRFLKAYLQTDWEDKVLRHEDKHWLSHVVLFCEECGPKVDQILELWRKLERLRMQFLWKVGELGEVIKRSKDNGGEKQGHLAVLARQLGFEGSAAVVRFKVKMLRREIARNCRLKARRILPKVKLRKEFVACGAENVCGKDERDTQFLVGVIIIYGMSQSWNLHVLTMYIEEFKCPQFSEISLGSAEGTKIPTRWTVALFCRVIVVLAIAKDWNLEQTLKGYKIEDYQPTPPIHAKMFEENFELVESDVEFNSDDYENRTIQSRNGQLTVKQEKPEVIPPLTPVPVFNTNIITSRGKTCGEGKSQGETQLRKRINSSLPVRKIVKPETNVLRRRKKRGRPVGWRKNKQENSTTDTAIPGMLTQLSAVEKMEVDLPSPNLTVFDDPHWDNGSSSLAPEPISDKSTSPAILQTNKKDMPLKRGRGRPVGWRKKKPGNIRTTVLSSQEPDKSSMPPSPAVTSEKMEVEVPSPNLAVLDDDHHWDGNDSLDSPMDSSAPALEPEGDKASLADPSIEDEGIPLLKRLTKQRKSKLSFRRRIEGQRRKMIEEKHAEVTEKLKRRSRKIIKSKANSNRCAKEMIPPPPVKKQRRKRGSGKILNNNELKVKEKVNTRFNPEETKARSFGFSMKCPECPTSFLKAFPLKDHLRKMHPKNDDPIITCHDCNKTLSSYFLLMSHVDLMHEKDGDKPHFCMYCSESFTTIQKRNLHMKNLHWIFPQELFCEVESCPEKYEDPQDLAEHLKSHSSNSSADNPDQIHTCDQCHWPFLSDYLLRLHKFSHFKTFITNYSHFVICDVCSMTKLRTSFELMNHFNKWHAKEDQKITLYKCTKDKFCPFYFTSEKYLEAHCKLHEVHKKAGDSSSQRRILSGKEKSYPCLYCNHEFVQSKHRLAHEPICPEGPSEERRQRFGKYTCPKCDFGNPSRCKVVRHMTRHGNAMFECPHCERKFKRKDNRDTHVVRVHTKATQYVCHVCGRVCAQSWELKYHLTEHEPSHMCPECGKVYSRRWLLTVHMRTHNGERLQCEFCPEMFPSYERVHKHLQAAHPEEYNKEYDGNSRRRRMYKVVSASGDGDTKVTEGHADKSKRKKGEDLVGRRGLGAQEHVKVDGSDPVGIEEESRRLIEDLASFQTA